VRLRRELGRVNYVRRCLRATLTPGGIMTLVFREVFGYAGVALRI
jgi:hypothetical protein